MAYNRKPVNAKTEIKKRAPIFDRKDRLSFADDPMYYRVWVNDVKREVQDHLDSGFSFVHVDDRYGRTDERHIEDGSPTTDSRVAVNVGRAGGQENVTAFLMQVPMADWEEMIAPSREEAKAPMLELQRQKESMMRDGYYGKLEVKSD